jgi:hypothetical protein
MTFYMVFYFTFCTSRSNFFAISTVICHTMSSSIQHIDTDILLVVNQKICYLKESHFYFNTSAPFSQILYFRRGEQGGSALNQGGHFVSLFIIYFYYLSLIIYCLSVIIYHTWKSFITSGTCSGTIPYFISNWSPVLCSIFTFCRQIANIFRVLNISRLCP